MEWNFNSDEEMTTVMMGLGFIAIIALIVFLFWKFKD